MAEINSNSTQNQHKNCELKPCPFCGNEDIACIVTLSYVEIHCRKCKATILRSLAMGKYDCLKDSEKNIKPVAVKAWNTRTPKERGGEK